MPHFITRDGARIAYSDTGAGRPLLFLHGLMAHGGFFREQEALAARHRLIRLDLRGHGGSGVGQDQLDLVRLAEDVAELAAALDLEAALGIGWSLGAPILWEVLTGAQRHRFAGAVVIDMTAKVLNGSDWDLGLTAEACAARDAAIAGDFDSFSRNAGRAIFTQPIGPDRAVLAEWSADAFAANDPATIAAIWSSLVDADFRPLLGRIAVPTLILHGANSQLYGSETAAFLEEAIADASVVRFARSGHAPHLEEPDLFNRIIADFAEGLPARAAAIHKER